jgi:hypothetical protein
MRSQTSSRFPRSPARSPINKRRRLRNNLHGPPPPPPKYHVTVLPNSPTAQRIKEHYLFSIEHLRAPLVPLVSVTSGLPHPDFPCSLLQYHLLTDEQLDSLARWYHQVSPPMAETFMYPAWIPAWASLVGRDTADDVQDDTDIETKRRRWGRFIGLRGCESPTATGPLDESAQELGRRMEREWQRALARAEEEERAWEKGWRGRW